MQSERWKVENTIADVLSQLSADLAHRVQFRGAKGFSPANLKYMRRFAETWPEPGAKPQFGTDSGSCAERTSLTSSGKTH